MITTLTLLGIIATLVALIFAIIIFVQISLDQYTNAMWAADTIITAGLLTYWIQGNNQHYAMVAIMIVLGITTVYKVVKA